MVCQNASASEGRKGDPIATPSICLYNMLLNIKCDSFVAKNGRSWNSIFVKPWTMYLFLKMLLVQISMLSSRGTLVKSELMSKIPMKLLESCSTISVANLNKSLIVYLLAVDSSKIRTKNFKSFNVGASKVDRIVLKDGQSSSQFYGCYKNHKLFQV